MPRSGLCQVKARVSVGFMQKSGQRQGKSMQILGIFQDKSKVRFMPRSGSCPGQVCAKSMARSIPPQGVFHAKVNSTAKVNV